MFLNKTQIQDYVLNNYGLFIDHRSLYHDMYRPYFSTNSGLWQQPTEITDLIYFLQDKNIKTFLNIGTFNGETIDCITNLLLLYLLILLFIILYIDTKNDYTYKRHRHILKILFLMQFLLMEIILMKIVKRIL